MIYILITVSLIGLCLSLLYTSKHNVYKSFADIGEFTEDALKEEAISDQIQEIPVTAKHLANHTLSAQVQPKGLLSRHERDMFNIIQGILPKGYFVQCQVSFNSFLKCGDIGVRNTFNRKSCDFLIVNDVFLPIVVVELDDRTHKYSSERDAARDALLEEAHIRTIRFAGLPQSAKEVARLIIPLITSYEDSLLHERTMITTKIH